MRRWSVLSLALALSACATARMHSEAELNSVARNCGMALGELIQDEEEMKLLFVFRVDPSPQERACVKRWARDNHLHPVILEAVDGPGA